MLIGEGRYRVDAILGSGSTATVYRAWDTRSRRECAVKVLRCPSGACAERRMRMPREAGTLARFDHPHILRVFDAGVEGTALYMVTELAPVGSLQDVLSAEGPLASAWATRLCIQALSALEAAHDSQVVHRDVKPSNLLLLTREHAVLADFGIARLPETDVAFRTDVGACLGSKAYMAPEQREAPELVTASADLYALAATLFALVTASSPESLHRVGSDSPRWNDVPEPLLDAIRRATRPSPAERQRCVAEFRAELQGALPHLSELAQRPSLRADLDCSSAPSGDTLAEGPAPAGNKQAWTYHFRGLVGADAASLILVSDHAAAVHAELVREGKGGRTVETLAGRYQAQSDVLSLHPNPMNDRKSYTIAVSRDYTRLDGTLIQMPAATIEKLKFELVSCVSSASCDASFTDHVTPTERAEARSGSPDAAFR